MKLLTKLKQHLLRTKKMYLFLFLLVLTGVISGALFFVFINVSDKQMIMDKLTTFMQNIQDGNLDTLLIFKNSLLISLTYFIFIWLLGFSIVGIPLTCFLVYLKGFILGFIISSIFLKYKLIGILGIISYTFPHYFINIISLIIVSYFSLNLSIMLFRSIVKKESIAFKRIMNKYYFILGFGTVLIIIASLFETFISPFLLKFFANLIK